jgi:hypothetical protein
MTDVAAEQLVTVKEYAAWVGRHPNSVYRAIKRGTFRRFPIDRLGRNIHIRVPTWMLQRQVRAARRI